MTFDTPPADLDLRQHNFSAGPGALPTEVLEEVRDEMPAFPGLGASIVEVSHRSAAYTEIVERAQRRMRGLLGLGDDWHVLFLQSGASLQFHQVPLNFLADGGTAAYLDTGTWSANAVQEARIVARDRNASVEVAASSADGDYSYVPPPAEWDVPADAAYLHYTSNNTIVGTQFRDEPAVAMPLVCDMSSDFLSRPIEAERYGLIYAGAQKNLGPAGATVVLVRDEFLRTRVEGLPTLLDYRTHAAKLFHTPPVFVVYVIDKVLGWIERNGGLPGMVERNRVKVGALYGAIDASGFYRGTARTDSRSHMNVTFRLPSADLEDAFVKGAAHHGLLALKGHRSVGGVRASIYNAVEPASVQALVDYMGRFEERNG